jgi:hypothetical protein
MERAMQEPTFSLCRLAEHVAGDGEALVAADSGYEKAPVALVLHETDQAGDARGVEAIDGVPDAEAAEVDLKLEDFLGFLF